MTENINIYGETYPIKLGYGATRIFCQSVTPEIKGVSEYYQYLKSINWNKLDFDALEDMVLLTLCGIQSGLQLVNSDKKAPSKEIIFEWFGENLDNMAYIMKLVTKSLPIANNSDEVEKKKIKQKEAVK